MKSFIEKGDTIPVVAPSGGLASGQGYLIDGTRFSVIQDTVLEAAVAQAWIGRGVVWLPKLAATVMTQGDPAFWDDDSNGGEIKIVTAAGHVLVGTIAADAASADTHVQVAVDGVHRIAQTA